MEWSDVMKFRRITGSALSPDGKWLAYAVMPDRGDGAAYVVEIASGRSVSVPRGRAPRFSATSQHCLFDLAEPFRIEGEKPPKTRPASSFAVVGLVAGGVETLPGSGPAWSGDGRWLAWFEPGAKASDEDKASKPGGGKKADRRLILRRFIGEGERSVANVVSFRWAPRGGHISWVRSPSAKNDAGAWLWESGEGEPMRLDTRPDQRIDSMSWSRTGTSLAWMRSEPPHEGKAVAASLRTWTSDTARVRTLAQTSDVRDGWHIPLDNGVTWNRDGSQVFFGIRPGAPLAAVAGDAGNEAETPTAAGPFDVKSILEHRKVDVWHWNDPLISTHQKKNWSLDQARRYLCVHHLRRGRTVCLGDEQLATVPVPGNSVAAVGSDARPYERAQTWEGRFSDFHRVELKDGRRTRIATRAQGRPSISPDGRWIAWWQGGHWHLHDGESGTSRNLTEGLDAVFADEDHDYPSEVRSHGQMGWTSDGRQLLLYDRFDIWSFPSLGGRPRCVTAGVGRRTSTRYRLAWTDPDAVGFDPKSEVLLHGFNTRNKTVGIATARLHAEGLTERVSVGKKLQVRDRAKDAQVWLYTQETYTEFPDLRIADATFTERRRVTDVNPQVKDFAWGTSRVVSWRSADGRPLQGALFEPEGERPKNGWPTFIYYYRFMSQRAHEWNQPVINHRPCFPLYVSNGYALFLPDIRFEIGRPGHAAVKCLVPGVQKLIESGVTDPEAIALHGHSWSGYQTAFVITQTDLFSCAIAGAPVSNMTSAYSGIRWSSGLARQFQYERTQSRLGKTLWDDRQRYIDNSPIFFADRINTPLLIQFGDEDGSVPWYQGIELYLACRRLDKDCVFLQYRKEGHHLKTYANKLDYAIRMRQYVDHYLKKTTAPKWIVDGERYAGR